MNTASLSPAILTVEIKHTKSYFIKTDNGILGIDAGWPGSYRKFKDALKEADIRIESLKWIIVTHFHIDHAGLAGKFLELGISVYALPQQIESIQIMEELILRKGMNYTKIDKSKLSVLEENRTREWLKSIGIKGEIITTDSHSPDSISLILDNGIVFTGDLYPPDQLMDDDYKSRKSWDKIRRLGGRHVKPAHYSDFTL